MAETLHGYDAEIAAWPRRKSVQVLCPGFSADCLETLEEIREENKAYFLEAGGGGSNTLLRSTHVREHILALEKLIDQQLAGWSLQSTCLNEVQERAEQAAAQPEPKTGLGASVFQNLTEKKL